MCFSPAASFSTSVVLFIVGTACVKKNYNPSLALFAFIPLAFAIQQLTEGILWVVLQNGKYIEWRQGATIIFASFGQLVWPLLVPFSILMMEKEKMRRHMLTACCAIGVMSFTYLCNNLIFNPVYARINGHHIDYEFDFAYTHKKVLSAVFYFIPTVGSHFISSIRKVNMMGAMVLLSLIITQIFYSQYLFSVWCFFSAGISLIIYMIVIDGNPPADVHDRQHVHS